MKTKPTTAARLIAAYLRDLDDALTGVPRSRRNEVLDEIAQHLDEALAALGPNPSEPAVRDVIDRLGDPDDIAAETREHFGPPRDTGRARFVDLLTIALLLFGGFLFVFGWLVGVVLLWTSPTWRVRDKLLGTFVWPWGYLGMFVLFAVPLGSGETCVGVSGGTQHCTSSGGVPTWVAAIVAVVALAAPIWTAVVLARRVHASRALA